MKRRTYKELESALITEQGQSGLMHCALNDLLNDRQTWFRAGVWRIGVSRENDASGGLVIVRQLQPDGTSYSCAYYFEDWYSQVRDSMPSHTDKTAQDLRNLAILAHSHILQVQGQECAA